MKYDFNRIIERKNTSCIKWDFAKDTFGYDGILPMWVADMDFQAPLEVIEAIKKRAEHGVLGYTGRPDTYYESIIDWMKKRYGWDIKKEWIGFSPGVVPALGMAVLSYTEPGDKVIIQPPVYPPFFKMIKKNGREIIENPLKVENGYYVMDFEDLENKIDSGVKILILCNPHNPVGRVWDREELERLGEICLRHNIIIVSDEIHGDIVYKSKRHYPMASLSQELLQNTITCTAPSKTFNIAGLSTSVTIIPNPVLRKKFESSIERFDIGISNVFGTVALETAYRHGEEWLEELLQYLEGNIDFLIDYIEKKIPEIKVLRPEGTYLAWLDCRGLEMNQNELREFMIKKARVGLNDGMDFGKQGEGFLRLNFACPRAILEEGLRRIEKAVRGR